VPTSTTTRRSSALPPKSTSASNGPGCSTANRPFPWD
jgi:hypothetical protein